MARTPRFGLNYFGQGVEGTFADDGGKHTGGDRLTLDRLVAALESHNHRGGTRVANPSGPPQLVLNPEGGQLWAGQTLVYRIAYVDSWGLETAASAEATVQTPAPVAIPDAPTLTPEAGGALTPGLWYYALTAVQGDEETPLSAPAMVTVDEDLASVRVELSGAPPAGADAIAVWRQGPFEAGFTRLNQRPAATFGVFLDDGSIESDPCPCDPGKMPPDDNLTNATSQVTLTIPEPPTDVQRWRIYRRDIDELYGPSSLVGEVVRTGGTLATTYTDTGATQLAGMPLEVSQTLIPSPRIPYTLPIEAELPAIDDLPQGYAVVVDGRLYALIDGVFVPIAGSGGEGDQLHLPELPAEPPAPTDGGVLYVHDGQLRFKGASGAVTIIGPA